MLKDLLAMSHIFNGLSSAGAAAIGYLITAWFNHTPIRPLDLLTGALATLLISNGGFIVNDIHDIDIDRINRPDRPLAAGRISISAAWLVYLLSTLIGIGLVWSINSQAGLIAILIASLLFMYSAVLKRHFLIGHIAIALMGAALLPFGALLSGNLFPIIYTVPVTFLAFIAREIMKTVPDVEGDKRNHIDNLATRYSPEVAMIVAKILLGLCAVALPLTRLWWPLNNWFLLIVFAVIWPLSAVMLFGLLQRNLAVQGMLRFSKLLFLMVAAAFLVGSL